MAKTGAARTAASKTRELVLTALFLALIILLGATPIGIIKIGPLGLTTVHIPVIIGGIFLGAKYGALLGFAFGTVSFLVATYTPYLGAFCFSPFVPTVAGGKGDIRALIVAFVPRILIGVLAALSFRLMRRLSKNPYLPYSIAAAVGSLTNTVLVLGLIFFFFAAPYAGALGIAQNALLTTLAMSALSNGVPEAMLAVLVALALGRVFTAKEERRAARAEQAKNEARSEVQGELRALQEENRALKDKISRAEIAKDAFPDPKDDGNNF